MPDLYLVIPEHTDAEGVSRSIIIYGADDAPDHFRAALTPPQDDPLATMQALLATGWEAFTQPHPELELNEVSEITFLGLDVVREGIRLSVLRGFPFGDDPAGKDLQTIVREAKVTVAVLLAERGDAVQ